MERMKTKKVFTIYIAIILVISLPFTWIHLTAAPDDSPIAPLQHVCAALANFFGPWGVVVVRFVDFPNAGLRSFSWTLAIGLTALGALLLLLPLGIKKRFWQILLTLIWGLFAVIWFGVGLIQIADGLL